MLHPTHPVLKPCLSQCQKESDSGPTLAMLLHVSKVAVLPRASAGLLKDHVIARGLDTNLSKHSLGRLSPNLPTRCNPD